MKFHIPNIIRIFFALMVTLIGVEMLRSKSYLPGLGLILLGIGLFILSMRAAEQRQVGAEEANSIVRPYIIPAILWTVAIGLAGSVIPKIAHPVQNPTQDFIIILMWLASIIFLMAGILLFFQWQPPSVEQLKNWFGEHRTEALIVLGVVVGAFILRIINITSHPYPWSGDESSVGLEGLRIVRGEVTNMFTSGWSSQPNWSFLPTALAVKLFGNTIFATRIISVIAGSLSILTTYLLCKEWFDTKIALVVSILLATFPYHMHFSRIGVNNIVDALLVTLNLWLLFRAFRTQRASSYALSGLMVGLSIYTYLGSRLIVALCTLIVLFKLFLERHQLKEYARRMMVFFSVGMVTAAPMATFFIKHPDIFMARINQEGILQNGWLMRQATATGQGIFNILVDQFSKTFLVIIANPALGNFFQSDQPYLTLLGSMLFLIGLGYALWHIREPRYFGLQAWFWSVIVLGGMLTLNPPANTRLVMASPAMMIFATLGLFQSINIIQRSSDLNEKISKVIIAVVVGIIAVQGVYYYHWYYPAKYLFKDANSEVATETAVELRALGKDYNLYMLGAPRLFARFPTIIYINPENNLIDLPDATEQSLALIDHNRGAFFVAIPERKADLDQIAAQIPGGKYYALQRKTKPEVLYYAYVVAPDTLAKDLP